MKHWIFCLTLFLASNAAADLVTFRVNVHMHTPVDDDVYVAGDFQGWNPGSPDHRLTKVIDFVYEITLDFTPGTSIQFKFTRGDWSKVEKGPQGEEIANRMLSIGGPATYEFEVANWADVAGGSTITGNVEQIEVPGFLNGRRVWIYLPPDYETDTDETYSVLYMLDGQNVFDAFTSFAGEWRVDESCEELIPSGEMEPIIVVASANGQGDRLFEYTPWSDPIRGGGGGEAHMQAIVQTLKPYVDTNYRTRPEREHTGFGGSSLGGLMAMYAAYAHSATFGRIASVSPSIQWNGEHLLDFVAAGPKPDSRIYADMGTLETGSTIDENNNGVDDFVDRLRALRDVLTAQGFDLEEDFLVVEDQGGVHNEAYWAARFPVALKFLFPPVSVGTGESSLGELKRRYR